MAPEGFSDQQKRELAEIIGETVPPIVERIVEEKTAPFFTAIQDHLTKHDERFEIMDQRLDRMDQRFEGIDQRFDDVIDRLDGIAARQDAQQDTLDDHERRLSSLEPKHI